MSTKNAFSQVPERKVKSKNYRINVLLVKFRGCCQQRGARFGDHCDLLSGLRVCWHGMTDADYHSWRKPITLVITAPSGSLSVEWNTLQNSLCIPLAAFCISSMLIPPVWVFIVQSMGPSRASEPSLAQMSFCFTKQGGHASREADELHSPICLLSLFMTKLFSYGPS